MRETTQKLLHKKFDTIYGYKVEIIDDYEELDDKKGLRGIDKEGFTAYYERNELYLKKRKKIVHNNFHYECAECGFTTDEAPTEEFDTTNHVCA